MHPFRKISLSLLLSLSACATLSACVLGDLDATDASDVTPSMQVVSDTDSRMEGALGLIFNMSQIDDRLDVSKGDSQDWRYIIIPEDGKLTINVNLDSPSSMEGGWDIYDSQGRTLHTQPFQASQGFYQFDYPVQTGIYYFKAFASSGASVYTIGATFMPTPPQPVQVVATAPVATQVEEPDDDPPPAPTPTKPKTTKPKTTKPSTPAPPPPAEGKKIVGVITMITSNPDGTAEVTIRNVGTKKGVNSGATGIVDGGMKLKTTTCRATSCIAIVQAANVKSLREDSNVTFTVSE